MGSYQVEVIQDARKQVRQLPGNIRQRVIRELQALQEEPRPHHSRVLEQDKSGIHLEPGLDLCRIKISPWRIIYVVDENWKTITVLAIRKRPPYQYEDLEELIKEL